jgi:phospholipid/cholesterol/gamma-HCH transport system permease protein
MSTTSDALPTPRLLSPLAWVGRFVIACMSYVGGVVLLACSAAGAVWQPARGGAEIATGFGRTMVRQLSWMLAFGIPLVGLVHIAMGSFLSLQAYYGSTFVDGTGAVVGVGLLRNLGGLMTGLTLSGILAARMIPELSRLARSVGAVQPRIPEEHAPRRRSPVSSCHNGGSPSAPWWAGRHPRR